ncbi:DUF4358 domain-containing protein [Clostridium culturomicium]|uniref:DUF4358 domain-containing protein n=1 Tax=Clostridium culturomicium TaxID=1499683 RepID=UPI00058AFE51|nr:DUF4358 domain-containing protein [Clostridium culturomicium]
MKKIYLIFYGILFTLVIVIFVGLYGVLKIAEPSMSEIDKSIVATADLSNMVKDDAKKLRQLYYINKNQVEDFILYAPKTNMDASEILVLKAKDVEGVKHLKEKVEARVDKQSESFASYRPELKTVIDDYKLKEKGQYLYLIISGDNKKIDKAIEKNF